MDIRRRVRVYAYMSSKGGVGKSTLSVVTAQLAAETGGEVVVLDLDMWGSSLGDGLLLEAPHVPTADDHILRLEDEPTGAFLTREETVRRRHERNKLGVADGRKPAWLPYLNDALFAPMQGERLAVSVDHFLWRSTTGIGSLRYLPSSPLFDDLGRVAAWLSAPELLKAWAARVWALILTLIEQRPGLTDIVCDLPPGWVGLSHPFRNLISAHALGNPQPEGFPRMEQSWTIEVVPSLVTTPDRQAVVHAAEAFVEFRRLLPELRIILNRADAGMAEVRRVLEDHFEPFFGRDPYRVDRSMIPVDESRQLGMLFRDTKGAALGEKLRRALAQKLRLRGGS